jgi:hypothetical protein
MKRIFLFAFFAVPYIAAAQSKLSYDLAFSVAGVSNASPKSKTASTNPTPYIFDSSGSIFVITPVSGGTYFISVPKTDAVRYKAKLTGGFTVGGKLNYTIYKNMDIGIGANLSYFKVTRSAITTTGAFSSSLGFIVVGLGSSGNWDSTRNLPAGTYTYSNGVTSVDKFKFLTANIPVTVSYSIAKWKLEAGIITSFIISTSKKTLLPEYFDPEIGPAPPSFDPSVPQPSPENKTKSFFSLSISPQYQLTSKLKIGIEYNHALSNVYSTNWYSQNDYPNMKTSSLGLKILYKLK